MTTLPLGSTDLGIWISKLSHCIVKLSRVSAQCRDVVRTSPTLQDLANAAEMQVGSVGCWKFAVPSQLSQCLPSLKQFTLHFITFYHLLSFSIIFYFPSSSIFHHLLSSFISFHNSKPKNLKRNENIHRSPVFQCPGMDSPGDEALAYPWQTELTSLLGAACKGSVEQQLLI